MSLLDFILNAAALLLWFSWRSAGHDPLATARAATLAGTIRPTRSHRLQRGQFLFFLVVLLFVRAALYVGIGPALDWVPKLNLGVINLPFRASDFLQQLLYSILSFLRLFLVFHFWLVILTLVNRRIGNPDAIHRLILLQLGRLASWPAWTLLATPAAAGALLWLAAAPALSKLGVVHWASSGLILVLQSLLVGTSVYLSLGLLIPAILLLHWIASYVYLGSSRVWDFIATSATNFLRPLPKLRIGKLYLTPLVGIAIVLAVANVLTIAKWIAQWRYFSGSAFARCMDQLILWPR